MRIIFIRHGEPDYERDCLTEIGREQAKAVAERLCNEEIDELWASPLGRAMETAREISDKINMPIKTLDFMQEVDWGSTDGKPLYADGHPWEIADEMARQGINLNQTNWKESSFFKTNEVTACVEKIDIEIDKWLDELGYKREGYYYYHKVQEEKHRTIVLVSHGGSSAAAMGHILNIPFPLMCALLHIEFTGINIIRFDRKKGPGTLPCIELGNDGKHVTEGWNHRLNEK